MKYCEAAIIPKGWLKGTNRNAKPIIIINQECNTEALFHILNAVDKKKKKSETMQNHRGVFLHSFTKSIKHTIFSQQN